jgi:F420-non-reducing hydrogenase iron-sulfur subunit
MNQKPVIIAFLCNWCSYTGADLAGTSRVKYAPDVRIIRLMCSGRVEPSFILKAFAEGVDGILICGCHPGDCHYHEGNYKCLRRYHLLQKYLGQMGIPPERLRLEWISASEGNEFAHLVNEFTETIRNLEPSPLKKSLESYSQN